jgi:hypothetical protein
MKLFTARTASVLSLFLGSLSVLFQVISMSVVYWVKLTVNNDDNYSGLFLRESYEREANVAANCNSEMSETSCTYLKTAKASSIISVILGGICLYLSFAQAYNEYRTMSGLSFLISGLVSLLEFSFLIICIVTYSYYNDTYLTVTDDINVEYPPSTEAEYSWGFNLMIAAACLSFIYSAFNFSYAFRPKSSLKRSPSAEGLFGFEK